jgi:hypothetical protein
LQKAAQYFQDSGDNFEYATSVNNLGVALLHEGHCKEALVQFDICRKVANEKLFVLLRDKAEQNYRSTTRSMDHEQSTLN